MRNAVISATISYLRASNYSSENVFNLDCRDGALYSTLLYLREGRAEINSDSGNIVLESGEFLFIPQGGKYITKYTGNPHIRYSGIHMHIDSLPDFNELLIYKFQKIVPKNIEQFMDMYMEIVDLSNENEHLLMLSKFLALFNEVKELLEYTDNPRINPNITPAIRYLKTYYAQNTSDESVASLCHLSVSRFHTLFKQAMGMTPLQFKNDIAMKHAMIMLRTNTAVSVEGVAESCGFASVTFFRRLFMRKAGISPREYRKRYSNTRTV